MSNPTPARSFLEEIGFERDARVPYKPAGTLPLGYLKRLELGRCLALRPELIICDEIFSGLSLSEINTLIPLLEKLQLELKKREARRGGERITVMGSILYEGRDISAEAGRVFRSGVHPRPSWDTKAANLLTDYFAPPWDRRAPARHSSNGLSPTHRLEFAKLRLRRPRGSSLGLALIGWVRQGG